MPLSKTRRELETAITTAGLTGKLSDDLRRLLNTLQEYHSRGRTPEIQIAVRKALDTWMGGNHPGEIALLRNLPEFRTLAGELQNTPRSTVLPPPPKADTSSNPTWSLGGVAVTLLSEKNSGSNFTNPLNVRLQRLAYALHDCQQTINANWASIQQDNEFHGIFLAPEYFFSSCRNDGTRFPMTNGEKMWLESQLIGLSRQYPKILIVPGTVFYYFDLNDQNRVQMGYQLLQAAKDRITRERDRSAEQMRLGSHSPRTVLNAEMSHTPSGANSLVPSLNKLADSLVNGTAKRVARNRAYLMLNGQIFARYDKHTDFYEAFSNTPDELMFIPGTQQQCPFIGNSQRRHRFGTEVCFDHANGVLKHRAPTNLHFHLVVSDYVDPLPGHMAMKRGGWFLHASTNHAVSQALVRDGNGVVTDVAGSHRLERKWWGYYVIDNYLINLPDPQP